MSSLASPIDRVTLASCLRQTLWVKSQSVPHSSADRVQVFIEHARRNEHSSAFPVDRHAVQSVPSDGVQHVALGPGISRPELRGDGPRVHPMMKQLNPIRDHRAQRHNRADLDRQPASSRRNDHNGSLLGHLWSLEASVEVAHKQRPGTGTKGQPHLCLQATTAIPTFEGPSESRAPPVMQTASRPVGRPPGAGRPRGGGRVRRGRSRRRPVPRSRRPARARR